MDHEVQRETMGASVGIFWVDMMCKPAVKALLKDPLLTLVVVCALYSFVAYKVLKATYLSDDMSH